MVAKPAKTTENSNLVTDFINQVQDTRQSADSRSFFEIMKQDSGYKAKMWGPAIMGFGSFHYKYGREGDSPLIAFSPLKAAISLYLATCF